MASHATRAVSRTMAIAARRRSDPANPFLVRWRRSKPARLPTANSAAPRQNPASPTRTRAGLGFGHRRDGRALRRDSRDGSRRDFGGTQSASADPDVAPRTGPWTRENIIDADLFNGGGRGARQVQLAGEGGRCATVRRVGSGRYPTEERVFRENGGGLGRDGTARTREQHRPHERHPPCPFGARAGAQTERPVLETRVVPRPIARRNPHGVPRRRDPPTIRFVRENGGPLGRRGASTSRLAPANQPTEPALTPIPPRIPNCRSARCGYPPAPPRLPRSAS